MPDSVLAIVQRLSRTRSEDEVMAIVSHAVRTLLQADGATFALRDGDHCYYADEDAISPLWKGRRLPMSGCLAGWCMINREAVAISDIHQDPRMFTAVYRPAFVRSLLVAPVGVDEPIAALSAYWSERRQPAPQELERLQAIADAAALALVNLRPQYARLTDLRPAAAEPAKRPAHDRAAWRPAVERLLHDGLGPNSAQAYAFALACVLAVTLLRLVIDAMGVERLAPFHLFYPATLVATLVGGKRAGALAAVTGGLTADYLFMPPVHSFLPFTGSDLLNLLLYGGSCTAIILIIGWYQNTVSRLKREDANHLTLARELQHRARNAVAVVETIVRQSLPGESDQARIINQRIRAAFADVDIRLRTRPIRMASLLTQELAPFDLARFSFDGEDETPLAPEVSSILTLAAHELATNALKYGALSVAEGQVSVDWGISGDREVVRWSESGGPRVRQPQTRGYGSVMLRRLVEAAGGAIVVEFLPTGVVAEISLPLAPSYGGRAAPKPTPAESPAPRTREAFERS